MNNVKRLNHDELFAMNNAEKEQLIAHLFDVVEALEYQLEGSGYEARVDSHEKSPPPDERRIYQRTSLPSFNSTYCEIQLAEPLDNSTPEYKRHYTIAIDKAKHNSSRYWHNSNEINFISFRLHDISMAGCSMVNHDEEFSYFLQPNMVYENCRIVVTGQEKITVSFKTMAKHSLEPYGLHKFNELIGIKFLDVKHHQEHSK